MEEYLIKLKDYITQNYGLDIKDITETKRGFFGETWCITTASEMFFVKIDYWDYHKKIYQKSFEVIEYLNKNGIQDISRIIKTLHGKLYCMFNNGIMGIFEYVDGENREDFHIKRLFEKLAPVYKLPTDKVNIEKELFTIQSLEEFISHCSYLSTDKNILSKRIIEILKDKEDILRKYAHRLSKFVARCENDTSFFVITHGDAGGNCIINHDSFIVVDWDQPKLAAIERDAWFFTWNVEQTNTINEVYQNFGIEHILNEDRCCYFCYSYFFYYLNEYIKSYLCTKDNAKKMKLVECLKNYFTSWIFMQLAHADQIN